jgi:hypothetical protein
MLSTERLQRQVINRSSQDFAYIHQSWYLCAMDEERIDHAIQRIEAALARIAAATDTIVLSSSADSAPPNTTTSDNTTSDTGVELAALSDKHEALRSEVAGTLRELDQLIEGLEA